ncbi:hypothetical protein DFH09DRAFT_1083633 [Mycena vulgaris]|nr:hypothetical protein DFH09DRAFT_1083633 [Mycena vulgaris]
MWDLCKHRRRTHHSRPRYSRRRRGEGNGVSPPSAPRASDSTIFATYFPLRSGVRGESVKVVSCGRRGARIVWKARLPLVSIWNRAFPGEPSQRTSSVCSAGRTRTSAERSAGLRFTPTKERCTREKGARACGARRADVVRGASPGHQNSRVREKVSNRGSPRVDDDVEVAEIREGGDARARLRAVDAAGYHADERGGFERRALHEYLARNVHRNGEREPHVRELSPRKRGFKDLILVVNLDVERAQRGGTREDIENRREVDVAAGVRADGELERREDGESYFAGEEVPRCVCGADVHHARLRSAARISDGIEDAAVAPGGFGNTAGFESHTQDNPTAEACGAVYEGAPARADLAKEAGGYCGSEVA